MIGHIGMHGTDDAKVVCALGHVREDITNLDPTLSMLGELEGGSITGTCLALGLEVVHGQLFAMILCQEWLGIEGVDLGRSAIHEEVNDPFRPAKVLGWLRCQRVQAGLSL